MVRLPRRHDVNGRARIYGTYICRTVSLGVYAGSAIHEEIAQLLDRYVLHLDRFCNEADARNRS
jgi:hypothetical protein